jgi:S-DNA-T family DNA segregation ATPase FtsK/SpoIIIE
MAVRRASQPTTSVQVVREAEALATGAGAVFLVLSLLSYTPDVPGSNLGGPVGHALADTTLRALGLAAYLFPVALGWVTYAMHRREAVGLGAAQIGGAALVVIGTAALAGVATGGRIITSGGGWLGGFLGTATQDLLGTPGALLLLAVALAAGVGLATGASVVTVLGRGVRAGRGAASSALAGVGGRLPRFLGGKDAPEPAASPRARGPKLPVLLDDFAEDDDAPPRPEMVVRPAIIREAERRSEAPAGRRGRRVDTQEELFAGSKYRLPSQSLLDEPVRTTLPLDEAALLTSSKILETKLADFGVIGRVVAVRPGPVITTFEFEPAPGVKVNRIVGLADDLSMALRALSVRVLAPIPGKPVVGIEVSNPSREKVFIRDLLQGDDFRRAESNIALALGKDTTGNVLVADLARMPHLLVAGATGTGKSVSMNAMIMSILFKAAPRDVRFIMIDPKMLELSTYEDIPHLLVPVVTDPKKAAAALFNVIREMEDRYRLLHEKGVRNVDSYNRLIASQAPAVQAAPAEEEQEPEPDEDGEEPTAPSETVGLVHRHLPRIVIIIDELADLMMTVGREIEESITRLAQKARAAGIHLILATQRPSVDVITGLIKANFPARISFQVTSRIDSRTILDAIGAERLLGEGDMLFLPPGTARIQRLHGAFVSDADVHRVVDFVKKQETPRYQMELLDSPEEEDGEGGDEEDLSDEMYDMAVRLVTEHRQASISWLQRRLRVGYNRAARMIERMEREGVVAPAAGARPREVIARRIED